MRWLLSGEYAAAVILEDFEWGPGRCSRVIKRPTEVFARVAAPDRQAVMAQHLAVQAVDQAMLVCQWRR